MHCISLKQLPLRSASGINVYTGIRCFSEVLYATSLLGKTYVSTCCREPKDLRRTFAFIEKARSENKCSVFAVSVSCYRGSVHWCVKLYCTYIVSTLYKLYMISFLLLLYVSVILGWVCYLVGYFFGSENAQKISHINNGNSLLLCHFGN